MKLLDEKQGFGRKPPCWIKTCMRVTFMCMCLYTYVYALTLMYIHTCIRYTRIIHTRTQIHAYKFIHITHT